MQIVKADDVRMPAVWAMWVQALHDHPTAFGASYQWARDVSDDACREILQGIESNGGFILCALDGEMPVGMLSLTRQQGEKLRHKGDIGAVYVTPMHRGSGLAKALVGAALEQARALAGLTVIQLCVATDNRAALHVYTTCGFVAYGTEPRGLRVDGVYIDLIHMSCVL